MVLATVEARSPQDRIGLEAGLLVGPHGPPVVVEHVQVDALQAQLAEAEVDQAVEGIGPEARDPGSPSR